MRLTQIVQAPVFVEVGKEKWRIPVMTLGDFVEWAAEVDSEFRDAATKGMTPAERFQSLVFFGVMPANLTLIKRMSQTPMGVHRILSKCLSQARVSHRLVGEGWQELNPQVPVDPETLENLRKFGDPAELTALAKMLAQFQDDARPPIVEKGEEDKKSPDPTNSSSVKPKDYMPKTGDDTSPSSTPPTQEKIPSPAR